MSLVSERVGQFFVADHRLEYTEYGGGDRWVVLVHGPLLARGTQERLARQVAASGAHVLALDLLGHGRSDRPDDPTAYTVDLFADQVLALLDEVGADDAVVLGTSLGANVALAAALAAPGRVRGLVLDRPALDNAVAAGLLVAAPLLFLSRFVPQAVAGARTASRLVPRRIAPEGVRTALAALDQQARPLAATVHGLCFGRLAPPAHDRRRLDLPALVVGHGLDPLHPLADAEMLAEEIPGARLVRTRDAARVAEEVAGFVSACSEEPVRSRLAGS